MLKALVPVDGSQVSLCGVRHAIELVEDDEPLAPLGRRRRIVSRHLPAATVAASIFRHA